QLHDDLPGLTTSPAMAIASVATSSPKLDWAMVANDPTVITRQGEWNGSLDSGSSPPPGITSRVSGKPIRYSPPGDSGRSRVAQYRPSKSASVSSSHVL